MTDRIAVATIAGCPRARPRRHRQARHNRHRRGILRSRPMIMAADRGGPSASSYQGARDRQRREHVRIAASVPASSCRAQRRTRRCTTFTLDVSGGGLLVAGAGPAESAPSSS